MPEHGHPEPDHEQLAVAATANDDDGKNATEHAGSVDVGRRGADGRGETRRRDELRARGSLFVRARDARSAAASPPEVSFSDEEPPAAGHYEAAADGEGAADSAAPHDVERLELD